MSAVDELLAANERFAEAFSAADLPREPRKRLVVVTCMDTRIDPLAVLGLELGDATVLRNAGGLVTDDVVRSLAVSHAVLGTREAVVLGHTECGLERASNAAIHATLGMDAAVDFLPFDDVDDAVRTSVSRIARSPVLADAFTARGYVYDVRSGRLRPL